MLNTRYFLGLALGCGGAIIAFTFFLTTIHSNNILVISSATSDKERVYWDGENAESELHLTNHSSKRIAVDRIEASCKCTKFSFNQSRPTPFILNPNETFVFAAITTTQGRLGMQQVQIVAQGRAGTRDVVAESILSLHVRPKVVAEPSTLVVGRLNKDQQPLSHTVRLLLATGAEDPIVESVQSTNVEALRVIAFSERGEGTDSVQKDGFKELGNFKVELNPLMLEEKFSEKITVHFKEAEPIQIPVYGWIVGRESQ